MAYQVHRQAFFSVGLDAQADPVDQVVQRAGLAVVLLS